MPVPVTQRDRDAASIICRFFNPGMGDEAGKAVLAGEFDDHFVAQAFAKHRRETSEQMAKWLEDRAARSKSRQARRIFTVLADDIRAGLHED